MKIIVGGRRSGRTTELIKKSAETGIYILVSDHFRARAIVDQARNMGYLIPFPVTVHEYLNSRTHFAGSSILRDGMYMDDVEDIIEAVFPNIHFEIVTCRNDHDVTELPEPEWWKK